MSTLENIFFEQHKNYDQECVVSRWNPTAVAMVPIWKALRGHRLPDDQKYLPAEVPTAYLRDGNTLYLGLSSGSIEEIDLTTRERVARYGPRVMPWLREPHATAVRIKRLLIHKGELYDVSNAGLFETKKGGYADHWESPIPARQLDNRFLVDAEIVNGRLCLIPHGDNRYGVTGENIGRRDKAAKAGHLVDGETGDVVFERIHPFDGSGCKPGEHFIHGDEVYIHHGNWPGERITIRSLSTGEVKKVVRIPTSHGFFAHNGQVYDFRMLSPAHGRETAIMPSTVGEDDEGFESHIVARAPQGQITSAISIGEEGILFARHVHQENRTLILKSRSEEPVLNLEGRVKLIRL